MQLHFNILAQLSSPENFWKDNNVYLYIIHNNRGNGWYSSQLKLSSHYFSFCKLLLKLVCNSPRRSTKKMWKPWKVKVMSLTPVRLFGNPWTVAYQAPPSMGFSRQEYWSGCHCLLRRIVPTQGSNIVGRHFTVWATRSRIKLVGKVFWHTFHDLSTTEKPYLVEEKIELR